MISELKIETGFRSSGTYLKSCYCTRPFKVANIREDRSDPVLRLMMMSSSPGMLDNDHYQLDIKVVKDTSLLLKTQAYQRLFTMTTGAKQEIKVVMEPGSEFSFLPHPLVPHHNAIYNGNTNLVLSENCRLTWGEIITCGRKLNGEVFQFKKLHNITEVRLGNLLVLRDNLLMEPGLTALTSLGWMEQYTHQASLMFFNTHPNAEWQELTDNVAGYIDSQPEILGGVSKAHENGIMVRLLGNKGEQLYECQQAIAGIFSNQKNSNVVY